MDPPRVPNPLRGVRAMGESAPATEARVHAEAAAEGPAKDFVALKATGQGDVQNGIAARQKQYGGAGKAQAQGELLGRLADDRRPDALQLESRQTRLPGQCS